ncbi:MAG: AAA family ATPase [Wujia sp.]
MEWGFNVVKVKEESRMMYELCIKRAESIGHAEYVRTNGKVSLAETYKSDMLKFLVYLAYADGRIQKEEIKYINALMGYQLYDFMIDEYAEKWDLKGMSILYNPPASLSAFVRSNIGPETGEVSTSYYDLVSLYITTFNYVGNDLISCNKDTSKGEIDALSDYIMMLKRSVETVNDRIEEYKPTIEFKPGSKVKRETTDDFVNSGEVYKNEEKKFSMFTRRQTSLNQDDNTSGFTMDEIKSKDNLGEIDNRRKAMAAEETKKDISVIDNEVNLEKLLEELNGLTGMESVKKEINNLVNLLKICKIRKEKGLALPPTTNHLVFLGNPGTGKTTVARILSKIYHGLGILSKGHLVEVDRSGLVAGYMGQTGEKVMEVVEKAMGGVLFIDEAYALATNKSEGDFGQEAIDILNKAMEDYRDDLIVIAAGYHDEMQDFLDANPGLRSRFNRTIEFPDYSAEELIKIMCNRAAKLDYRFDDEALAYANDYFNKVLSDTPDNFGNARSVRNYLENAINRQANRLIHEADLDETQLTVIKLTDIEELVLS